MPMIEISVGLPSANKPLENRRLIHEVVGATDVGASSRGSTYYSSLLNCAREHGLLYDIGLSPKQKSDALNDGWLYHHALETYYRVIFEHQKALKRNGSCRYDDIFFHGAEPDAAQAAWKAIKPVSQEPGYEKTWETVSKLVDQYLDRYANTDRWEIVAIEETLEYWGARVGSLDYTCRLDLIIIDHADGRMWVVEHKTARNLTRDLLDYYDLDLQICGQMWCLQKCVDLTQYPRFGGVCLNIATKHKDSRYIRHPVLPSQAHIDAFEQSVRMHVELREEKRKRGWPKSLGHCSGYARGYSYCQFYEVCREHPSATVHDLARWADPPHGYVFRKRAA